LFEATTIARLSEDFQTALDEATKRPDLRLSELEEILLDKGRRERLREAENYENALHGRLKRVRRRVVSN
jgi:hypothetical protein